MRQLNIAELNEVHGAVWSSEQAYGKFTEFCGQASTMVINEIIQLGEDAKPYLTNGLQMCANGLLRLSAKVPATNPLYVGSAIVGIGAIGTIYLIKEYYWDQ